MKTIVVVGPNDRKRDMTRILLERAKHTVIVVSTLKEAEDTLNAQRVDSMVIFSTASVSEGPVPEKSLIDVSQKKNVNVVVITTTPKVYNKVRIKTMANPSELGNWNP